MTRNDKTKQDNYLLYVPMKKHQHWQTEDGKVLLLFEHNRLAEKFLRWLGKRPAKIGGAFGGNKQEN